MKLKASLTTSAFGALVFLLTTITTFAQAQGGFTPDATGLVYSIAVQSDNKILAAVGFANDGPANGLRRFEADGRTDPTFGSGGHLPLSCCSYAGRSIAILPDGKILFGSLGPSGSSVPLIRKLNNDGTLDNSFSPPAIAGTGTELISVSSIVVGVDGKIYIGGGFATVGGVPRTGMARLHANGTLDTAFANVASDGGIKSMILLPDGKLLVAGNFNNISGASRTGLARLNSDGSLDTAFSATFTQMASYGMQSIARQSDGKLVISGGFTISTGQRTYRSLARLNADGTLDPSFLMADEDQQNVRASDGEIVLQPDGKIVQAGCLYGFEPYGPNDYRNRSVCRYNSDGSPDRSVLREYPVSNRGTFSVALQSDGKILLGGSIEVTSENNEGARLRMVRVRADGTWDLPFARFDFDGDRRTDLAVFRPSNQTWYVHTGQAFFTHQFGESTDLPTPADYDFDGRTDYAVFRQSNGTWYWINSSTITFNYVQWGAPGDLPVPGHRVPGHRQTFDIYRPSTSSWYRRAEVANGQLQFSSHLMGNPGDIPLAGHMGLNLVSRPAVFRPSNNTFYHTEGWGAGAFTIKTIGQSGDLPLSADFDGDLRSDPAVYSATTGQWTIQLTGDQSNRTYFWGEPGDIPVPADYDGDQRDDIAIWRPSTGTWYIIGSTEGWQIRQFGEPGDIPIPSSYLYGLP